MTKRLFPLLLFQAFIATAVFAQESYQNPFRPIENILAPVGDERTAAGAPGPGYWQQRTDYDMDIRLDDEKQMIFGKATITFYNTSPHTLTYLWLQMEQNMFAKNSLGNLSHAGHLHDLLNKKAWYEQTSDHGFDGGYKTFTLTDAGGKAIPYDLNETMLRADLAAPLKPGAKIILKTEWSYPINNQLKTSGRTGYEYFETDSNYLYEIAQFFPRLCVYDAKEGWQNKQFTGDAEFALPFGNYKVKITLPAEMTVGATGTLTNEAAVLTPAQRSRMQQARKSFDKPILIITDEEAEENAKSRSGKLKTWMYEADNVRDFAFAASRKFIWDAMAVKLSGRTVMAMALYPKEGNPLWQRYGAHAVAHALEAYSKYTIDYPYPHCTAVHGPVFGMEYPMINFNGGRPAKDGSYSETLKHIMIAVVIHEVGHNFFPMIINSDERKWAWMDEGLNSFVEFLAEQEWSRDFPSRRGFIEKMVPYMSSDPKGMEPIMAAPDEIRQLGHVGYGKPATALNVLRETVLGRERFDRAFKEYCRRWAFKHPDPADFFRTMEDVSGTDLDWFWRGWFYENKPVDIALAGVKVLPPAGAKLPVSYPDISSLRNKDAIKQTRIERYPYIMDKYDSINTGLAGSDSSLQMVADSEQVWKYELNFENKGGLISPIPLLAVYEDGTEKMLMLPVEIWRKNPEKVAKVMLTEKPVAEWVVDPYKQTGDIDIYNNRQNAPFEVFIVPGKSR